MNRNINVTHGNDTSDNILRRYDDKTHIDFRGITILTGAIIVLLTLIWLIVLAMVKFDCWWNDDIICTQGTYVFWGYLAIYGTALIIALIAAIPFIYQAVKNTAFIRFRGIVLHRNDIRQSTKDVLNVALESAKSESSAGLDTYSPSISTSNKEDHKTLNTGDSTFSDEIPLALLEKL